MSKKRAFYKHLQNEFDAKDEVQVNPPKEIKFQLIENEAFLTSEQLVELENLKYLLKDKKFFLAHQRKEELLNQYINDKVYLNYTKTFFELIDDELLEIQELTKWFDLRNDQRYIKNYLKIKAKQFYLPNSKQYVFKFETEISNTSDNFINIFYEAELYPKWLPFCKESKTILQPDIATKIVHILTSPPIFSDREMLVKVWCVDNFAYDGSFLILSHSIDKRQKILDRYGISFQPKSKNVRGDLHAICIKVEPLSLYNFKVTFVFCMDPKSEFLSIFGFIMLFKLDELLENYQDSKWETKDPKFYYWLRDKFKDFELKHANANDL